jgi:hypothetical protein
MGQTNRKPCHSDNRYGGKMTPVQRTMKALREKGSICTVVEKWNAYGGEHGIRVDLFGILDVLVLDPVNTIGIQCCGTDFRSHVEKLTVERAEDTLNWLQSPHRKLFIWGWRKIVLKRGGKAMRWEPRIKEITIQDVTGDE